MAIEWLSAVSFVDPSLESDRIWVGRASSRQRRRTYGLQIGSSRLPEALLPPLLRNRWRIEGQGDIFVDRSLLLLDRRAASARGFMPHIVVSHDVRLRAGAGK